MNVQDLFAILTQFGGGQPAQPAQAQAQPAPAPGFWQTLQNLMPGRPQTPQDAFVQGLQAYPGQVAGDGVYDPSKQVSGGRVVAGGVRPAQIDRAVMEAEGFQPQGQGTPGGQGFFKPLGDGVRKQLTPAEAEAIRRKLRNR